MFPKSISDISSSWLKEVTGFEVKHFTYSEVSKGKGFAGQVFKLNLAQEISHLIADTHPSTLAVKFASKNPSTRKLVRPYAINETNIYSNLSKLYGNFMPVIYFAECDEKTGDFCILMEDLSTQIDGDSLQGLSHTQATVATTSIARLHSKFWDDPKLNRFSWLKNSNLLLRLMRRQISQSIPTFLDSYGNGITKQFHELLRVYPGKMNTIWNKMMASPSTMCHGDFRPDNFFFGSDGKGIRVIDWQLCSAMKGIVDVSYLVAWGIDELDRKSWESQLLTGYHDTLISEGVKNYSRLEMIRDYSFGFFLPFQILLVASTALDNGTERGSQLISSVISRMESIIDDHELLYQISRL